MMISIWRGVILSTALLLPAIALSVVEAQERFPNKPITLITPYAAGGSSDLTARVFTTYLRKYLGQPMLIRLVPGQAGQKGTLEATQAAPDGYTLVYTDNYRDQLHRFTFRIDKYDTNQDLVSVARINYGEIGVIVRADGPYQTWADIENAARANPSQIKLSHSGLWAALFVPAQHMMQIMGLQFRMVPYRGGGPAKAALMAGDVDFSMAFPATIAADIEAGLVRVLATAGPERIMEGVPSFVEIGLPPTTGYMHRVVMGPRGIPEERLAILRRAIAELQSDEAYLATMRSLGENTEYLDGLDYEKVRLEQQREYRELIESIAGQ